MMGQILFGRVSDQLKRRLKGVLGGWWGMERVSKHVLIMVEG